MSGSHFSLARDVRIIDARLSALEEIFINIIGRVDPPPSDLGRLGGLTADSFRRGPITDPAASDRGRLQELIRRPPHGDPAVTDLARRYGFANLEPGIAELIARLLWSVDPPPSDIARLGLAELEASVRAINAELVRLKALEGMLSNRVKELGKEGGGQKS